MTAHFVARLLQPVRAYPHPVTTSKRRHIPCTTAVLAGLFGTAAVALESIAVAQPAGDTARSESVASGSMRAPQPIHGPDVNMQTKSTAIDLQYHSVPGTAFQAAQNGAGYTHGGYGCMYQTSGALTQFFAPVYLPNGSIVKSVRFNYYDASVENMALYFVQYDHPGQAVVERVVLASAGTAGRGTALSPETNFTIDHGNFTYALIWTPSFAISAQQICGVHIAYYPPATTAALCSLDADGNGNVDPLSDGILILRAMFGLTGTAVTNNAIGSGTPSRTTWAQLRTFFNGSCGASFAQ